MKHRTLAQWQDLVEQQRASGLSIAAFCRQNDINTKTFYNRCAKLDFGEQVEAPAFVKATQTAEVKSGFIQVNPEPAIQHSAAAITLQTSHAILQLPSTASPQWVGQLLRELRA